MHNPLNFSDDPVQRFFGICFGAVILFAALASFGSNPTYTAAAAAGDTIQKALIAYGVGWSDNEIEFTSYHFDLVDMDFNGCRTDFYINYYYAALNMKSNHSDIIILGYKNAIYSRADQDDWEELEPAWFLKDAGGNVIFNTYWNFYLMDINNDSYRTHWIDYVNGKIAQGIGVYDGVFVDDCWGEVQGYYTASLNATIPAARVTSWHEDTEAFLTAVHAGVSGLVVVNSDEWHTDDYIIASDGQMLEGYVHTEWDAAGTYDSTHLGLGDDFNRKNGIADKILFCASGTVGTSSTVMAQCYNNFVANATNLDNAYWSYNSWFHADSQHGYYSIMDTELA